MTAALYRHTDRLPDGTFVFGCHTLGRDGRTPVPLGCAHATPREAIAHKTPVYVSPTPRVAPDPNRSLPLSGASGEARALREAPAVALTGSAGASPTLGL